MPLIPEPLMREWEASFSFPAWQCWPRPCKGWAAFRWGAVSDRSLFLLPLLLAIQAAAVNWAGWAERPPAPAELAALPGMLWPWEKLQDNAIPENARALDADRLFDRRYVDATAGWTADLFIAWFHSQRE